MRVALMVAMARNRVIGRNNKLPWYLPEDLRYFKRTTLGKPIIMGRRTFDSIGRPLPGRANIVVSRQADWHREGTRRAADLPGALTMACAQAELDGQEEVVVIGGEQIYRLALPLADRLYLTLVHAEVEGDAWFPDVDWTGWRETGREDHEPSGNNPNPYSFLVFDRKQL